MMRKPNGVTCLVGGQYGSEGKGVIVNFLANLYDVHVRTGAPNAGHSFYHKDVVYKMQSIPCGWTNPKALIVIGAGGLVNPDLFMKELMDVYAVDKSIVNRVMIDAQCGILDNCFHEAEGGIHGEMHKRIGSTGEGVGPARVARINRDESEFRLMRNIPRGEFYNSKHKIDIVDFCVKGVAETLSNMIDNNKSVMLEGTQGSGLSLVHGHWPYVTSSDTNAAQMCADAGVSPMDVESVILTLRTFPIRVAGNSGPLYKETTWEEMSRRVGKNLCEQTTVTKKIRRVGEFDWEMAKQAVVLNRPTSIALTFADYISPESEGVTRYGELGTKVKAFIYDIENQLDVPVKLVSTGGPRWSVIYLGGKL